MDQLGQEAELKPQIKAIWRVESARIIAYLTRVLRGDVAAAEEAANEAFLPPSSNGLSQASRTARAPGS